MRFRVLLIVALTSLPCSAAENPGLSPETLRWLAQQLGPSLDTDVEVDQLKRLTEQLAANPALRTQIQELIQKNPDLIKRVQSDPQLLERIRSAMPNPSDAPPVSRLPRDLNRPTNTPSTAPKTTPTPSTQRPENVPSTPTRPSPPNDPLRDPNPVGNPMRPRNRDYPRDPGANEDYTRFAQAWEQFIGPMSRTPAVQDVILQMMSRSGNRRGNNPNLPPWMQNPNSLNSPGNGGFSRWFSRTFSASNWNWLQNIKAPDVNLGNTSPPSMSMGGSFLDGVSISAEGATYTIIFVFVAIVLSIVVRQFMTQMPWRDSANPRPIAGLGPWPIDPRTIRDREGLVRAFDYLSVLVCGDSARVWNHVTIAEALRDQIPVSPEFASRLARYYALARYSPANEQISTASIMDARECLCQLAGVTP